jgi:small subunit ribosomal protein S2
MFDDAMNFISSVAAKKGKVLFVGTKRAASEAVKKPLSVATVLC